MSKKLTPEESALIREAYKTGGKEAAKALRVELDKKQSAVPPSSTTREQQSSGKGLDISTDGEVLVISPVRDEKRRKKVEEKIAPGDTQALVQELLKSKNVDGLRNLVASSEDLAVPELLVDALDNNPDPQIKIMAIDSLGLTSDPRAVSVLMAVFNTSTGGFRNTAALSLANIACNRVTSPDAIPSLMLISKDRSLDESIRSQAIRALMRFANDNDEVRRHLGEIENDPTESLNIKVAAHPIIINGKIRG